MNISVRDLNKILSRHTASNDVKAEVCNFLFLIFCFNNSSKMSIFYLDQTSEKETQEPLLRG